MSKGDSWERFGWAWLVWLVAVILILLGGALLIAYLPDGA